MNFRQETLPIHCSKPVSSYPNLKLISTPEEDDAGAVHSPARKKTINGEAGTRTPRTLRSTPRRKKRYQTETWLPGITHALLKECMARKGDLQSGNPPNSLWKEVTDTLNKLGFKCEWQACREKFESMNMFF
ncbi:uncharacterized protein LOC117642379 [Thrips palmi]|uniref:Uncharacterized protein LOC117642379 n=1 Tax=Thrips palmi TaxID=161013 RepID=A0A6P8Y9N3_THRPL|nr:uncharacterized protein LOC117642379 [Thrips palmi]